MKNKSASRWIFKYTLLILFLAYSIVLFAQQKAFVVIGQPDFTSGAVNQGGTVEGNTLRSPGQTLIMNGKFIVADQENNRVLIYDSIPIINNASADVVIGQYDFIHGEVNHGGNTAADALDRPSGLATDGQKLFVLDRDNYRVLIYNSLPTLNGASADVVIGQQNMTDRIHGGESAFNDTVGLSAYHLSTGAAGLLYDDVTGKLIVYDSDNDRVLIYDHIPDSNGVAADVVIGQPDFNHNMTNQGGPIGSNAFDLSTASGLAIYNGKLFIADRQNNRVLIYNEIPTNNNAMADVVIGQVDFTHNSPNQGGAISAWGMDKPRAIAIDKFGRLYIAEAGNARILVYNQIPTSNGAAADHVIGQPNFTTGVPSTTDSTFQTFIFHLLIQSDTLIVTDGTNNRILFFTIDAPSGTNEHASIKSSSILLYPNPNPGTFSLIFNEIPNSSVRILVSDMLGREIYSKFHEVNKGEIKLTPSNLRSGVYNLMVIEDQEIIGRIFLSIVE